MCISMITRIHFCSTRCCDWLSYMVERSRVFLVKLVNFTPKNWSKKVPPVQQKIEDQKVAVVEVWIDYSKKQRTEQLRSQYTNPKQVQPSSLVVLCNGYRALTLCQISVKQKGNLSVSSQDRMITETLQYNGVISKYSFSQYWVVS